MMLYWTDLHLERDVDDQSIVEGFAAVFGVPAIAVAVTGVSDDAVQVWDRPGLEVFVQRDTSTDRRGEEFPVTLMITLRQADTVDEPVDKIRSLAERFEVALMTDVGTEGDVWRLVMPDGQDRLVLNDPAGEALGTFVLAPLDRQVLEQHRVVPA